MRPTNQLAVIFDVDGVLVDSYEAHLRSWQIVARECGVPFTEADFVATFGRTSREIIRLIWKMDDERRIREIDDRKEALYRDIVARDFPAMDGAGALIDALHAAGFLLAMGSSGPAENVQLALERLGRREKFSAAISGADVSRGKPDPEIFLKAASRLGVAPDSCAVIEDSPPGVRAANAAAIRCVVLLSRGHRREDFAGLDCSLVAHSLRELGPDAMRRVIAGDG